MWLNLLNIAPTLLWELTMMNARSQGVIRINRVRQSTGPREQKVDLLAMIAVGRK
jgi:hypothetical protein